MSSLGKLPFTAAPATLHHDSGQLLPASGWRRRCSCAGQSRRLRSGGGSRVGCCLRRCLAISACSPGLLLHALLLLVPHLLPQLRIAVQELLHLLAQPLCGQLVPRLACPPRLALFCQQRLRVSGAGGQEET